MKKYINEALIGKINNYINIKKNINNNNHNLFQKNNTLKINQIRDSDHKIFNKQMIKNNLYFEKIKTKNSFVIIFLLKIIIYFNMISLNFSEKLKNNYRNLEKQNIIYLKIKGKNTQKILYSELKIENYPDFIYINNKLSNFTKNTEIYVESEEEINQIKIIWNKKLVNLKNFFNKVNCALEIDLSEFDTSLVTNMQAMFRECFNLKSINFGNINTSLVRDMSYMFHSCESLTSLNITNFDTSKVTTMDKMFCKMKELKELDLSKWNASNLITVEDLFWNCFSLTYLNFNLLNSSKLKNMIRLFENCYSLTYLNISKLDTSSVINMNSAFYACSSLTSLDLSNFNTTNVENMDYIFSCLTSLEYINISSFNIYNAISIVGMFSESSALKSLDLSNFIFNQASLEEIFSGCHSLTSIKFSKEYKLITSAEKIFFDCSSLLSIDLFNFDFGMVENFKNLFHGCASLTSIDLSYIDTFSAINMESLFDGCNSLETLNFEGWITSSVNNTKLMFHDCTSLISLDLSNFDTSNVINMGETFSNCNKLKSINFQNFKTSNVNNMKSMFSGCTSLLSLDLSSFDTSKVESMESMFYNCYKLTSLNLSNFNTNNLINVNSMFFLCKNLGYINLQNFIYYDDIDLFNMFYGIKDNLVICIDEDIYNYEIFIQDTTLDNLMCPINDCSDNWKEKKNRIIDTTKTCVKDCQNGLYKYEYDYICYNECPKGTHSSNNNKYLCEKNLDKCLKKYEYIYIEDNSCAETCSSEEFFNKKCALNIKNRETKKNLIDKIVREIKDKLANKIIDDVVNCNIDKIIIDNGTIYQITSSVNQKNNIYKNISVIDLGECESILKEEYKDDLIIFKVEQKEDDFLIPLIEFEIFNEKTKEKINLDYCENRYINILIPVKINENILFKYQTDNSYYNDICSVYTSEFGTDMTLYDRKNDYNIKHLSLCSNNCKFINYDFNNSRAICQCRAKNGITLNKDILLNELKNSKNYLNLRVMKCFKLVFSKTGFFQNMGNYIILLIIILYLISIIYFYFKGYALINNQIEELIINKLKTNYLDRTKYKDNFSDLISKNDKKFKDRKNTQIFPTKINSDLYLSKDILNDKDNKNKKNNECGNFINYGNYEINNISYEEALKNDNRTFFQIYLSLLKENHILIFSFNPNKDYNSYIIKICLFFLIFSLIFFINTLFFNDSAIHQIYIDKGIFNFSYFSPQIVYSIIICSIIYAILRKVYLTQKDILEIKYENNKDLLNARILNIIKRLNIKFICFFIINTLFLVLSWFYLSSFCVVYVNSQIYLLKVLLISFIITIIYPFFIYLIPGMFRILSLRKPEKRFYNISKFIQYL